MATVSKSRPRDSYSKKLLPIAPGVPLADCDLRVYSVKRGKFTGSRPRNLLGRPSQFERVYRDFGDRHCSYEDAVRSALKYNRASRLHGWKRWAIIDFDPVAARLLRSEKAVEVKYDFDHENRVWSPAIRGFVSATDHYNRELGQFESDGFRASFDLQVTKELPLDIGRLTRKQVIAWFKEAIATLEADEHRAKRGKLKLVG